MAFHSELSETCVDILSTYAYANLSAKPKRIPTAEFLLKNGQSCSWIIGTKIITITTSTCDQTSNRGTLCDRCYLVCLLFYWICLLFLKKLCLHFLEIRFHLKIYVYLKIFC